MSIGFTLSAPCTSPGQFKLVVFDDKPGGDGKPAQWLVQSTSRDTFYPPADRARQMMVVTAWTDRIPMTAAAVKLMQHSQFSQHIDGPKYRGPSHSCRAQTLSQPVRGEGTIVVEDGADHGTARRGPTVTGVSQHFLPFLSNRLKISINVRCHVVIVSLAGSHRMTATLFPSLLYAPQLRELPTYE
jgi:hypothetical protein